MPRPLNFIVLGIRTEFGPIIKYEVVNINFEDTVRNLKDVASKQTKKAPEKLELIYHGTRLDDDKILKEYKIKLGDMVHVMRKSCPVPLDAASVEPVDIKEFVSVYRSLGIPSTQSSFTYAMAFLSHPDSIEKFLAATPELADDPVALTFLTEPELVFRLIDPDNFATIAAKHPVLVRAVVKILTQMDSEKPDDHTPMYPLLESDEDEDADMVGDGDDDGAGSDDGQSSGAAALITSQQLSAALALAGANRSRSGASGSAGPSTSDANSVTFNLNDFFNLPATGQNDSESAPTTSRSIITPDMFSDALSQAFIVMPRAPSMGETSTSPTAAPFPESPASEDTSSGRSYTSQLLRMREMGLVNNRMNLRALIISGGDVNAAIDLVLSGAIED